MTQHGGPACAVERGGVPFDKPAPFDGSRWSK